MFGLTSVDQEHLYPEVCIARTNQEDLVGVVELEKVVPEVADQRKDLLLDLLFVESGNVCFDVLTLEC